MRLTRIAGTCPSGSTCPTIYRTDRGTLVVQGHRLAGGDLTQMDLPDGESAVEVPASLLEGIARADCG